MGLYSGSFYESYYFGVIAPEILNQVPTLEAFMVWDFKLLGVGLEFLFEQGVPNATASPELRLAACPDLPT